jgi:hypothetical protein
MKPKNGKAIGSIKSKIKRNHEIVNTKNKTRGNGIFILEK